MRALDLGDDDGAITITVAGTMHVFDLYEWYEKIIAIPEAEFYAQLGDQLRPIYGELSKRLIDKFATAILTVVDQLKKKDVAELEASLSTKFEPAPSTDSPCPHCPESND